MTNDERMQRESSLIATIKRKLPEFVKAFGDDIELVLLYEDAFAADSIPRDSLFEGKRRASDVYAIW